MNKWDRRFLHEAVAKANWSKDPSTGVGAVIADARNRVISQGYNGPPHGVTDGDLDREEKLRRTIHAEENALLFAQQSVAGCTLYLTHPPCGRCAAKIVQVGITRVVHLPASEAFAARWADDIASAYAMFEEAGVRVEVPEGFTLWEPA